jgi:hypothetical protein
VEKKWRTQVFCYEHRIGLMNGGRGWGELRVGELPVMEMMVVVVATEAVTVARGVVTFDQCLLLIFCGARLRSSPHDPEGASSMGGRR